MRESLLGIDIGGTGCKAVLLSPDGTLLAQAYRGYPMLTPRPGWVEQDPEAWWEATVEVVREIGRTVPLRGVRAVGISCTNALVAVNGAGTPLRPAIMLWDQRAVPQVEGLRDLAGQIRLVTRNRVAPGTFSLPSILWIRQEEPDVFSRTYKFLVPTGFIVQRLTGEFTIDPSRTSTTLLFDLQARRWSEPLAGALGVPPARLPEVRPSGAVVGPLTPQAAAATGLLRETVVVTGCMDTVSAAISLAAVEPGSAFIIMGTATRLCAAFAHPPRDDRFMNACHAPEDLWLAIAAMSGTGSSLRWFAETFGRRESASGAAGALDPFDALTEEAETAERGAQGLVYLPYLAGERSPIWDPFARGVFCGLTLRHRRAEIIRSILEGAGFAVRHNLEILEREVGQPIAALPIAGGGAKSRLWCQIIADITGRPLLRVGLMEAEAGGAAVLAGAGGGILTDIREAARGWLHVADEVTPAPDREHYDRLFGVYRGVYDSVRRWFPVLASASMGGERVATS